MAETFLEAKKVEKGCCIIIRDSDHYVLVPEFILSVSCLLLH
jgi:hypothetical protein